MKFWKKKPEKWVCGCHRSPFKFKDWDYQRIARSSKDLPLAVDLLHYLPEQLYQGPVPTCVGVAIAHQIMIEEAIRGTIKPTRVPSRSYIYQMSLKQHQGNNLRVTGTFPRLAYNGVARMGCPPESVWKYSTSEKWLTTMPSTRAKQYAFGRYGLQYYFINKVNRSQKVRNALASGHPVTIGAGVTASIQEYKTFDNMILRRPGLYDPVIGYHYMVIVGYENDYFKILNSNRGSEIILMHEDFIEWKECFDFVVITGWNNLRVVA